MWSERLYKFWWKWRTRAKIRIGTATATLDSARAARDNENTRVWLCHSAECHDTPERSRVSEADHNLNSQAAIRRRRSHRRSTDAQLRTLRAEAHKDARGAHSRDGATAASTTVEQRRVTKDSRKAEDSFSITISRTHSL